MQTEKCLRNLNITISNIFLLKLSLTISKKLLKYVIILKKILLINILRDFTFLYENKLFIKRQN